MTEFFVNKAKRGKDSAKDYGKALDKPIVRLLSRLIAHLIRHQKRKRLKSNYRQSQQKIIKRNLVNRKRVRKLKRMGEILLHENKFRTFV